MDPNIMDEDMPPTDEPLSYADDVPYDAQMSDATEQEKRISLKKRIGNRIYLIEDSMSKKRKLASVEFNGEQEIAERDADSPYRPNAILLQGPPITQIPTARVFAYATHFDAHPIGLEWIDDETCVLVFTSRRSASQAWGALCRMPLQLNTVSDDSETSTPIEMEATNEGFSFAQPLPLALYPIEERINSVLGHEKSNALKQAIRMRWALTTDVKERGARVKSEFYKRHGEQAGKEGIPLLQALTAHDGIINGNKRRKRSGDETRRRLDEELDVFLVEDEGAAPMPLDLPPVGTQRNKPRGPEDRTQREEEQRRILDYELDSFLANGGVPDATMDSAESNVDDNTMSQGPSLVERTARADTSMGSRDRNRHIKRLPRRDRRKAHDDTEKTYRTDVNGRWLHNSEVYGRRRRRDDYDEEVLGMRAWSNERYMQAREQPMIRKTHEELDRELDQLSKETD